MGRKWLHDEAVGFLPKNACGVVLTQRCAYYEFFREDDVFTRLLQASDSMANVYLSIGSQLEDEATSGTAHNHYIDLPKADRVSQFWWDVRSNLTRGMFGSRPIDAFMGSYNVDWTVVGYDPEERPVVEIHVQNATTIKSATTNPYAETYPGTGDAGNPTNAFGFEHPQIQSVRFRVTF
jgi:hypothetical protein